MSTRVVVLEKQARTGGWCKSVEIELGEGRNGAAGLEKEKEKQEKMVFETGPRSIRPVGLQGWLTIDLAHSIGLTPRILTVPKTAPSAKNRYVLYPTSPPSLLPSSLPSALTAFFTSPLLRRALPGILLEPFRPRTSLTDESVDAFFTRRFGRPLAENMISAMIHGIYSGDTRLLSVRVVFPGLWDAEQEWGSVVLAGLFGGLWRKWFPNAKKSNYRQMLEREEKECEIVKSRVRDSGKEGEVLCGRMEMASVWGVEGGLEKLTDALRDWLEKEGVEVWKGDKGEVRSITTDKGGWIIHTGTNTLSATHLISTLPSLLPSPLSAPPIPASTVSVINLAFPSPPPSSPSLFPPGFGYLIPRSIPLSLNPHRVLGVIYDSDVMPSVDTTRSSVDLTKVSLLLGGSYWLSPNGGLPSPLPNHKTLISNAMETIRLHFPAREFPQPLHTRSETHLECIPQVPVGFHEEVRAFGERLRSVNKGGERKVAVVGGGLSTIGVNGAVKGAWEVGSDFARDVNEQGRGVVAVTGVEMWEQ